MPISGDVVGVVGHGAPWVSVPADLAIAVSVVQKYELFCDLMMIRSHLAWEHAQTRIPVALRWRLTCHIPKDLVVGSILFDDIDDILDRTWISNACWNDRWNRRGYGRKQFVGIGAVAIHLSRVLLKFLVIGEVNNRKRSADGCSDVGVRQELANELVLFRQRLVVGFLGIKRIRFRLIPFAYPHEDPFTIWGHRHRSRVPTRGNETLDLATARGCDIDNSDAVVICVGHQKVAAVGRYRQGVWSAPLWR